MVKFLIPAVHAAIEVDTQPLILGIFEHARSSVVDGMSAVFGPYPIVWCTIGAIFLFCAVWNILVGVAVLRRLAGRAAHLYKSQFLKAVVAFLVLAALAVAAYDPLWIKLFFGWIIILSLAVMGGGIAAIVWLVDFAISWLWKYDQLPLHILFILYCAYLCYKVGRWTWTRA